MTKRKRIGFRSAGRDAARKGTTAVSRAVGKLQPLAPGLGPILGRFWSGLSVHVGGFLRAIPGFTAFAEQVERAGGWFTASVAGAAASAAALFAGFPTMWAKLGQALLAASSSFSGVLHEAIAAVTGGGAAVRLGTAVVAIGATAVAFVLSGGAPGHQRDAPTTGTGATVQVAAGGTGVAAGTPGAAPVTYADSVKAMRDARVKRLTSDTGWLTVAGLYWLKPGENSFGSDSSNAVVLPTGAAPGRCGAIRLETRNGATTARLVPAPGADLRVGDSLATAERAIATDENGSPDVVRAGRLQLFVIKRGERHAIRMRDPEASIRKQFTGIDFYPVDPALRVEAAYTPFDAPRKILVPNIMGYTDSMLAPGRVTFTVAGKPCSLTPVLEDPSDSSFFFIFADGTTEEETYGGGRFLYATPRGGGAITLDFNGAYNPPCAFTPFTTCPMPPDGNRLSVPIRAGEKMYAAHDPTH